MMQRLVTKVVKAMPNYTARYFAGINDINKAVRSEFGQHIDDEFLPERE